MILVDSSVFIDFFNGVKNWQTDELNNLLGNKLVILGDYILAEVLQGFRNEKDFKVAKEVLQSFPCLNICNEEIAVKSAMNFRFLRAKGVTIRKTVDLIIGTFCIENDIELLHNDRDFELMGKHLSLKIRNKAALNMPICQIENLENGIRTLFSRKGDAVVQMNLAALKAGSKVL